MIRAENTVTIQLYYIGRYFTMHLYTFGELSLGHSKLLGKLVSASLPCRYRYGGGYIGYYDVIIYHKISLCGFKTSSHHRLKRKELATEAVHVMLLH